MDINKTKAIVFEALNEARNCGIVIVPNGGYASGYNKDKLPPYPVGLFGALSVVLGDDARSKIGLTFKETMALEAAFNNRPSKLKKKKAYPELEALGKKLVKDYCYGKKKKKSSWEGFADYSSNIRQERSGYIGIPLAETITVGANTSNSTHYMIPGSYSVSGGPVNPNNSTVAFDFDADEGVGVQSSPPEQRRNRDNGELREVLDRISESFNDERLRQTLYGPTNFNNEARSTPSMNNELLSIYGRVADQSVRVDPVPYTVNIGDIDVAGRVSAASVINRAASEQATPSPPPIEEQAENSRQVNWENLRPRIRPIVETRLDRNARQQPTQSRPLQERAAGVSDDWSTWTEYCRAAGERDEEE